MTNKEIHRRFKAAVARIESGMSVFDAAKAEGLKHERFGYECHVDKFGGVLATIYYRWHDYGPLKCYQGEYHSHKNNQYRG